jgi:hypothetical protein
MTTPTHPPRRRSSLLKRWTKKERYPVHQGLRPGIANKDFRDSSSRSAAGAETAVYGGTGLVCLSLLNLSRVLRFVSVRSEEGQWSEFSVDLQRNPADIEGISFGLKSATLLLVSDQPKVTDQVEWCVPPFQCGVSRFCSMKELKRGSG